MADVAAPSVPADPAAELLRTGAGSSPAADTGRRLRAPDPRVMSLDRTINAIFGLVLALGHPIVCLILWLTSDWPRLALLLVTASWLPMVGGLVWLCLRWPQIDYRHRRYALDERGIEIWSGVVWREAVAVPRSRVQHIDVSQGPLERSWGLATLSIYTAGTAYSRVDLRGLDRAVALELRDALLPKDDEPAV